MRMDRIVDGKPAFLCQQQRGQAGEVLGRRADAHASARRVGDAVLDARQPEPTTIEGLAVARDADDEAGPVAAIEGLQQGVDGCQAGWNVGRSGWDGRGHVAVGWEVGAQCGEVEEACKKGKPWPRSRPCAGAAQPRCFAPDASYRLSLARPHGRSNPIRSVFLAETSEPTVSGMQKRESLLLNHGLTSHPWAPQHVV
ncbi:hypothetical protein D9M72_538170 [compost metagenome]